MDGYLIEIQLKSSVEHMLAIKQFQVKMRQAAYGT